MEQIKRNKFLNEVDDILKKAINQKSLCMCPECKNFAINSHVFQEERILRPIAPKNHLYCFEPNSLFNLDQRYRYKWRGITQVLAFPGFCNPHDNSIFSFIEKEDNIDWFNPKAQFLIGYKSLCRELYIKQISLKCNESILAEFKLNTEIEGKINSKISGLKMGINDFVRYKEFIENGIFENNFENYSFTTFQLPFNIELCVSSPISVSYSLDLPNKDIFEADLPETNIINIFPYKGSTYIIIGFATGFENRWANALAEILKTQDSYLICKSLSDLILFRSDFNCMSERLFHSISPNKFSEFFKIYEEVGCIKSYSLSTDLNIFKDFKTTDK